jgi:hypothetical protein
MMNLVNAKVPGLTARVEDNTWYMLAVELEVGYSLGADNESNFYTRSLMSTHMDSSATSRTEYWAPNFSAYLGAPYNVTDDTLSNISFYNKSITSVQRVQFQSLTGMVPSVALHLSKNIPTSVGEQVSTFKKFDIFPNPATNTLNVNLDLEKQSTVVVTVMNTAAQSMGYFTKHAYTSGGFTINTSAYPAGTYYLVVGNDNGTEMRAFTIVR